MKNLIPIVVVGLLIIGGFMILGDTPAGEIRDEELSQEQKESLVSVYITEHISRLSPEPEVLGGTFYVTNIEFTGANTGTVAYEDGHVALLADFEYRIEHESGEKDKVEVALSNVRDDQP